MGWIAKHTGRLVVVSGLLVGMLGVAGAALAVEVGERAPDFTLPSTTGENISLSQFRNKKLVLLEFYVSDFGAT
jgi:hypothetical protein